jgi:CRP/FNR family transcriptional regulator, anaerobic regulatory protein
MNSLETYLITNFSISKEDVEKVVPHFKKLELHKGDYFIKMGRVADRMAFIESGLIRIYAEAESAEKEVTQWISTPGYFITELSSFVFQKPSRLHLQALEDSVLYSIDKTTHQHLCNTIPEWNELDKKFIAKCFVMLEDRIFSHLYMTAEERFKQLMEYQPELFNKVPLQYLASMLGMTPETLSRMRKKL